MLLWDFKMVYKFQKNFVDPDPLNPLKLWHNSYVIQYRTKILGNKKFENSDPLNP